MGAHQRFQTSRAIASVASRSSAGVAFGGALALAALSFMTAVGWAGATF